MKLYVVYDKETGEIVHKYRLVAAEDLDSEDTLDCEAEEVLSSYRGEVPHERLEVAKISDYLPQTSRGRTTRYDPATGRLEHERSTAIPQARRTLPPDVRSALGAREE